MNYFVFPELVTCESFAFPSVLPPFSGTIPNKEGDDEESTETFFLPFRLQDRIQGKRMEIKEVECREPSLVLVGSGGLTQLKCAERQMPALHERQALSENAVRPPMGCVLGFAGDLSRVRLSKKHTLRWDLWYRMCIRECPGEPHQRKGRKQDWAEGKVELQCGPPGGA